MTVARKDVATLRHDLRRPGRRVRADAGRSLVLAFFMTLACTDIVTLLSYFGVAAWLL